MVIYFEQIMIKAKSVTANGEILVEISPNTSIAPRTGGQFDGFSVYLILTILAAKEPAS